ncbi:TetR/AcrR family transcriptional regulator [Phenylobacterium sp. 20VBR1]|uniref:TetR/AcrR family transcriptional regulator n=1 Tax=Phenylobacterium glaciei TaxID=2803784 RepID=A0A941HVC2_9CAUL|nr:TetR/AcrR family transcriptional regulator [Phenylobacterium glaciei]MBR7618946.1 TetR/AcrR family transcriptional regulator [Phenylobacterium glaciei]
MGDKAVIAPEARRSQAERTASMRARLIDAAVDCLNRLGYSATTLSTIAEAAGVSRGGMLHQFPSKVDLMLAVVAYASGADERSHQPPALNDDDDKLAYFMSRTETTWTVLIQEPAMAKLEIMMAARSDKVLAAKLPDMFNSIEQNRRHRMWELAQEIGIEDREAIDAMVGLHMAAMRGLAMELLVTGDRAQVERSFALLKSYKDILITGLLAKAQAGRALA